MELAAPSGADSGGIEHDQQCPGRQRSSGATVGAGSLLSTTAESSLSSTSAVTALRQPCESGERTVGSRWGSK